MLRPLDYKTKHKIINTNKLQQWNMTIAKAGKKEEHEKIQDWMDAFFQVLLQSKFYVRYQHLI